MAAPSAEQPFVSVIVPALDEAAGITAMLAPLQPWRGRGVEVILVDGGSADATRERAAPLVDRLVDSARGRAVQMNAGAALASAPLLWFLHADTALDHRHLRALRGISSGWGRFDLRLSGRRPLFRLIGLLVSLRSRLTGIATGDQAVFVSRELFRRAGGFPEQPLMEDVALSVRLKRLHGRPRCLRPPVITDSRRWRAAGAWRTIWLMWRLRWRYWRGEAPEVLHRLYHRGHDS